MNRKEIMAKRRIRTYITLSVLALTAVVYFNITQVRHTIRLIESRQERVWYNDTLIEEDTLHDIQGGD